MGNNGNSEKALFLGCSKITADSDLNHEIKIFLLLGRNTVTKLDSILRSRHITLPTKVCLVKAMVFPVVIHVWMWDYIGLWTKENWVPKNWCFWTVVLDKTIECPLDIKEIKPVSPKGNQSWIFIGRADAEAKTPIVCPPDGKNWLTGKQKQKQNLMLGKIEGRKRRDRRRDSWMVSLTWWTWVWASSRSWWQIGKPDIVWSMGLQSIKHDWATELNWTGRQFKLN